MGCDHCCREGWGMSLERGGGDIGEEKGKKEST